MTERSGHTDGAKASWGSYLFWAGLLLAGYVLSLGPAARLHQAYPSARGAIEVAYHPLASAIRSSDVIAKAAMWYLRLWGVKG